MAQHSSMTEPVNAPDLAQATRQLTAPGAPYEVVEQPIRGCPLRCWKNVPATLRELVQHVQRYDARPFLVYEDERLSYAQACELIARLARRMQALGVAKGDRVAIAMRNYPQWPLAFFATTAIGAIAVPLNAWWKGEELAYGLTDSGCKLLFADDERVAALQDRFRDLPLEHLVVVRGELPAGLSRPRARSFDELVADDGGGAALPAAEVAPDDDATIFYTSGTTGFPRGALGTPRNLLTNVGNTVFLRARAALRRGEEPPDQTAPGRATLISVPLFHVTGCHSQLAVGAFTGQKLVLMYKWNPERALELIERERVTQFGGVPAMVWQVLESPDFARRDTSSVSVIGYGGAPAAPALLHGIKQAFPEVGASNGYGLTETSALTSSNMGLDYERKPDSVGPPLPVCDVKVMSEDGRELPAGEVGELWVRGPNIVKGYWNQPEATAESFPGCWLRTGDIVKQDDEGFLYLLDRGKDMLIRGGENVYCVEVEDVLYRHPDVIDAAVIGFPHRVLGEEVGAVVQLRRGARAGEAELKAHAAKHLAAFKVPIRIELRDEPLPRNANGKILKRRLKQELLGG